MNSELQKVVNGSFGFFKNNDSQKAEKAEKITKIIVTSFLSLALSVVTFSTVGGSLVLDINQKMLNVAQSTHVEQDANELGAKVISVTKNKNSITYEIEKKISSLYYYGGLITIVKSYFIEQNSDNVIFTVKESGSETAKDLISHADKIVSHKAIMDLETNFLDVEIVLKK